MSKGSGEPGAVFEEYETGLHRLRSMPGAGHPPYLPGGVVGAGGGDAFPAGGVVWSGA